MCRHRPVLPRPRFLTCGSSGRGWHRAAPCRAKRRAARRPAQRPRRLIVSLVQHLLSVFLPFLSAGESSVANAATASIHASRTGRVPRRTVSRKQMWWTDMPKADDKLGRCLGNGSQMVGKWFAHASQMVRKWFGCCQVSGVGRVWFGCGSGVTTQHEHATSHQESIWM